MTATPKAARRTTPTIAFLTTGPKNLDTDPFHLLDPTAYAHAFTAWLEANNGLRPRSLARDGKCIGDGKCGMTITLCRHEDGRPVAMIHATGKKEDCEVRRKAMSATLSPVSTPRRNNASLRQLAGKGALRISITTNAIRVDGERTTIGTGAFTSRKILR